MIEAIDFSRFTDLAERYRERGNYRHAATIYRALAEGIDENMNLVDAAYDHYAQAFRSTLDAYVECVSMADLGGGGGGSARRVPVKADDRGNRLPPGALPGCTSGPAQFRRIMACGRAYNYS